MAEIVYLDSPMESEPLYEQLCPPVRRWFRDKFPDFTAPQKLAIPSIMNKEHLLLCSPTGSGKTLTAFLSIIDNLVRLSLDQKLEKKVHAIYISPIKALANDIQRNLIGPLKEITENYLPDRAQEIRVGLRTGDTSQSDRQKMLRKPPHILITTPEILAIDTLVTWPLASLSSLLTRYSATVSKGSMVAEIPIRCTGFFKSVSSKESVNER